MNDKICTLVGFAVRARKVIFGADDILLSKKRKYLVISDETLSNRGSKNVREIARKCGSSLIISLVRSVEDMVYKTNCKVIAITDKQMAEALTSFVTEDYLFINSEEL